MENNDASIAAIQKQFCMEHSAACLPSPGALKSGLALATKGSRPINGLRHPPEGDTTGWYIWCGEEFSESADFFSPIHTRHVYEDYPELTKLLGLPPGYRFLLDGNYLDVWYDASLLQV